MSLASPAEPSQLGTALYAVHAVAAGVMGLVLLGLQRAYRREFLGHWALSWGAMALQLGAVLCASSIDASRLRELASAVVLFALCAQPILLLSGSWSLAAGRGFSPRQRLGLGAFVLVCGAMAVVAVLPLTAAQGFHARALLRGPLLGLVFLGAAAVVGRAARREPAPARVSVAVLLALVGAVRVGAYVWLGPEDQRAGVDLITLLAPQVADLFLQLLLALGLLAWFFEDERRALARTLAALTESERQRQQGLHMEAVGRLAGGVAHDFNNLLTAICGHTEMLLQRKEQTHPDREDLLPIARASERAAELVRDLLTFSGRQPQRPRHFVLDEHLADLHRMLARLAGENVRLELLPGAPSAVLHADPAQIELAVLNLVANARDAIAGSGVLTLRTRMARYAAGESEWLPAGRFVLLEVADTGCGIAPESLGRIFEPYYTTKPQGNGLGLSSVYGIVKQSGGEIRVESEVGRGTTFHLALPLAEGAPERIEELSPARAPRGGDETILLLEDEPQVRVLAQRLLTRAGYRVVTVGDADEAAQRLNAEPQGFQLVLSDVVLPGRSVRDFLDELALRHPRLPVMLMSGYAETVLGRHGVEVGRYRLLAKPFTSRALLEAVRATLDEPARRAGRR